MNTLTKTIELLEAFGVTKTTGRILSGHEESYYLCTQANGDKVIHLSDDVDLGGVFEEEKVDFISVNIDWKSDSFNSVKFPIQIISFN